MIVNIKKRYAYAIIGLLVLAVGVFVINALTPGVAPNPGHLITQVAPPAGCGEGQVLKWDGTNWGCVVLPVDTDDQTLSISGQSLSISSGNSVSLPGGGTTATWGTCTYVSAAYAAVCPTNYFLVAMDRHSCTHIPGKSGEACWAKCCKISIN